MLRRGQFQWLWRSLGKIRLECESTYVPKNYSAHGMIGMKLKIEIKKCSGGATSYRDNAHVQEELSWMIVKKCKTGDVVDSVLLATTVSGICP
jgi:hypothetical protein